MLFKGNSSKLELLIEKIQANKEGSSEEAGSLANEEVSVGGPGSSWDVGSDGRGGSLSPASSRATPTSAGEVTDVEAQATLGVTSQTPYQCAFCDRAFPRLSYLKRHEQHCCSLSANRMQKDNTSTSSFSMALNNIVAFSATSKTEYKKDFIDSNTKSKVAVVWCTKPAIVLNENNFPQCSLTKVANHVSCISKYPESENMVVPDASNMCVSSIITLPQPLEIKGNEKKLYCYTSAGLVSKPAVFSASLSTSSHTNHLDTKQLSKGNVKVGGGMQCIVTSMVGSKKKFEGKRKVGDSDVTEAVERVVKHKKNFIEKQCYNDSGCRRLEVCFPKKSKDKLNENESTLKCNITSSNFKKENYLDNGKTKLQTQVPIHTIVSLNSDISKSIPSKLKSCISLTNQNVKNNTKNLPLETTKPKIDVPIMASFSEVSIQPPKVIAQKEVLNNSNNECCVSNEKKSGKISANICVVPSSYVMNNTLGKSSIKTNDISSALQSFEEASDSNPPIPNISISLVSIKPVSIPVLPPMPVSKTEGLINANIKNTPTDEISKNINAPPKNPVKVDIPVSMSVITVKKSDNTKDNLVEDDGVNGQGNVWVEEKMYSFVEEELRQLGDPVSEDKMMPSNKESMQHLESKTLKMMSHIDKDNPKSDDVSTFTDSSGEIITEDVFSYIENELMRLDAMDDDDIEPLNTSSGDLSSSISVNSSVNDSGFCPSGMKTPDSSQHTRKMSTSSCALSVDDDWSLLSSKGSMDLQNITASSDNLLNVGLEDLRPRGRRSTFSEFNRPNKPAKPRLRRFSISDSHGTLNMEKSPGGEPLLCLKVLDSLKMETSDHSCRKENASSENTDIKKDTNNDELCKVAEEKSPVKTTYTDALEISSLEPYIGRNKVMCSSNNPQKIDSYIQNTTENYETNSICNNLAGRKDVNIQIRKEKINNFSKKRSVTQVDLKDVIDIFSKKSKNLEQDKALIEMALGSIENEEKAEMDKKLQSEIANTCSLSPQTEMDSKDLTLEVEDIQNNLKNILNVQIPLTHVQLSKKHYGVLSPSFPPNISNPKSNTVNSAISFLIHDHLSSPILQTIDPFHYQCTPPYGNKIKQSRSPIISPISPALPENDASELEDQYSWLSMTYKTPVSTNTTTTTTVSTAAPSNAYVFVTPPSFHSSSSSTVTLEETPSSPVSICSVSPNSNQSVAYQKMQSNCQLVSSNPVDDPPTSSLKEDDKMDNFNRNSLYGKYLNTYLKYLKPQSLNDKVSDTSIPSFYLADNTPMHSDLYTRNEEAVKDTCKSHKAQGLIPLKMPYPDHKPKNFISNLDVLNSKNDNEKHFFTSIDFLKTIDGRTSKGINSYADIDEIEFPKRLNDFTHTKCSPSENNNETCENLKCDLNNLQNEQDKSYEMHIDGHSSKIEEHLEDNDMDAKQPSVHIQVRTGALAEQRGKSRAILSKLSQPLIHAGLQRPCKVEPKVILIRTGLNSPDSPTDNEIGKADCFPDTILDDSYDRKFLAENLLHKSNQPSQYIENNLKVGSKQSSNLVYPKFENLGIKSQSNLPDDNNLPRESDAEDKIAIGNSNNEMDIKGSTCTHNTNSRNENKNISLKTSHNIDNNNVKRTYENEWLDSNENEWLDSKKQVLSKKSTKKNITKKNHGKGLLRKFAKEKEISGEKDLNIKKEKNDLPDKSEDFFKIKNMKIIEDEKDYFNNVNVNKFRNDTSGEKSYLASSSLKVNEKEYLDTSLENSGALVPGLHPAVYNDETCSFENFREKDASITEVKPTEKTKSPADVQSHIKTSDYKNTNIGKGKLISKEQSKCNVDSLHGTLKPASFISDLNSINIKSEPNYESQNIPDFDIGTLKSINIKSEPFYESQSTSASFICGNFDTMNIKPEPFYESQSTPTSFMSNNLDSIKIKSEPLMYESDFYQDTWEQNVGNFKCVTKVIEGTAMIRAAIRKKKYHAARVKRNNIAKGRRKKAEKKKTANLSKRSKYKSSLKETFKNKLISYSRAGEIFDPNNLSTASGDALMAGITVHCTPEGVTLKLNCVENMEHESLKLASSGLNVNKSSRAQSIAKSNKNFLMSPSKNKPKCKDNYPHITNTSNKDLSDCVKKMDSEYLKSENSVLKENKCSRKQSVAKDKENCVIKTPSKNKEKCNNFSENGIASNTDLSDGIENTNIKSLKSKSSCLKVDKSNVAQNFGKTKNDPLIANFNNNDLSNEEIDNESLKLETSFLIVNKSNDSQNIGKSKANIVERTPTRKSKCKENCLESTIARNNVLSDCVRNMASESLKLENSSLKVNKYSLEQSMAKVKENFVVTTQAKKKINCNDDYPENALENNNVSDGIEKLVSESLELDSPCLNFNKSNEVQNIGKTKEKIVEMSTSKTKPKLNHDYHEITLASTNGLSDYIENTESEYLKSESSSSKVNKSNQAQNSDRFKDNFVLMTSSAKLKCKDNYSETNITSNNGLPDCHAVNIEKSQQILVSSITKATESTKETINENIQTLDPYEEIVNAITEPFNPSKSVLELFEDFESLDSYEETGNAITESVNPSKSVLELFEDFESLLGSMEDGDPENRLISKLKFRNPVSQPKEQGDDMITLNGSSGFSTFVNCNNSSNNDLPSTSIKSITTNSEVNLSLVQMPSDISIDNKDLSAESLPSNVTQKINKNVVLNKPQKQLENCQFEMNTKFKQTGSTECFTKNKSLHSQTVCSKQKNLHLEKNSVRNKTALEENSSTNKSLPLSNKCNNLNGINFASNEIQINYKVPNTINKCTFPVSNNRNYTNTSHDFTGKKSKRKSLFENKACQSNSNTNYVYSRSLITQKECNGNFKNRKNKPKFGNQFDFDMKNTKISKTFECKKDKNNNEFEHDHNYNSKRFRRKRKHKDLKVDCSAKIDSTSRNSNIKCTKEIINHSQNRNQRNKLKNTFKDDFLGSSLIDSAYISNKGLTEKVLHKGVGDTKEIRTRECATEIDLHNRESTYTIYQEKNVIAVSKTSILLNNNTKGKSNVPFEPETESVKINTFMDDSSTNLETINTKKFKANKQIKKTALDNKMCSATFLQSIDSENSSSNFSNDSNERSYQLEKKGSFTDNETCAKSNVTTSKASVLERDENNFETKVNYSIESGEKITKKLSFEKGNYLASPKHDSVFNNTNDNPQSSPDSPHFGLIHKLAQTSANSAYTKIVVKKVRSSSIDRKKNHGLLSTTLKRNIVTQKEELTGDQLQVKKDISIGNDFSNAHKDDFISTKQTSKIESSNDLANPNKDNSKSHLSKCDSNVNYGKSLKISSNVQETEVNHDKLCEKSTDQINNIIDIGMSPLENLEEIVDNNLPKVTNEYSKFEQKKINVKNSCNDSGFVCAESSSVISVDVISKDINLGNSDVKENISFVHTFLSTPKETVETGKMDNIHCLSSNAVELSNEGMFNQQKFNASMNNLQPLDLRLERSEVPCGPDGPRLTEFSYSVDLDSGLVNVISSERPEYTANIRSEVLVEKIKPINELAIPTSISPVYAVQTLDNCSAAAVCEVPLIMPVYSVCESSAQTNSSQVMQIYSYNAEDFTIGNYNPKCLYSNPSSISSVLTPNISISNAGGNNDGSLVVPVYSIASSNNLNICSSDGLAESSAILETSQTFPVYLLNPFDSTNSLPCAQISTIYTGNILDESINLPSEPGYGPHIMPIYSVEAESHLNSTTFGIGSLSSTSENDNIVNIHNLEVADQSGQNSSGGDIVVNVEYIENITKSLDQERLEKNSDISVKKDPEKFEYYIQKGSTDFSNSIITEKEYQNVESIKESINYNYVRSVTEIGNLDTEISNMEYPENLVDLGNLEYGDNIKSEPEDDESSNTDIGSNHGGSEGGVCMDFMLLDSMTHADQLPFRCEFCGRLFKHKRSRDRHVKLHTGDKKYKCCHCEAAFSRSDHLKIHMKTHDTQKPYQCSVCNRGYNTAAALTAHMQNHKAKLTAHALNQLLKDHSQESPDVNTLNSLLKDSSQNPADTAAFSQLLKEASSAPSPEGSHPLGHLLLRESPTDHHTLNHFLGDPPKEQLDSPRGVERGAVASPIIASPSPGRENCSPASSPVSSIPCPICHVTCRNHTHLQRHMSRHHSEDSGDRPASRGGSGISSTGGGVSSGVSSTPSTPSPRPPSSLSSPRLPIPNPFMFLVGGKLSCIYCSRDGFLSLEALQMHIQSQHSSLLNGDSRDMASALNLPSPLGSSLGAGGLNLNNLSPLAPSSSRGVTCELCGARVSGVPALQRHVVTAHTFTDLLARAAEGVFCAQCLLPFSNPGALAEHIKLVHASPVLSAVLNKRPPSPPNEGPTDLSKKTRRCDNLSDLPANTLLCSQCNAPFTNFEAFRRHLKTHLEGNDHVGSSMSGSQQLICPECRLPLTSENALEVHMATHLGATCTEYGCQACLKLFQKPDELQKHLMDIHAHHLYRCALCKEMFDSKVSIQVHFAVKHSNECKVHKCTRCSLIFRTQSEFEAHVRSSHLRLPNGDGNGGNALGNGSSSNGMYRCLLCTLSLSSEAELAAHVSTHQRQFQCSLCDDAFHVEFLLDKHMQSAHNSELNGNIPQPENLAKSRRSPLKKELKCDICDSDFSSEISLLGHRKQAHNIKNNSTNNNNTKNATTALSLFCAYCSEACKSRADLEIHMKSHQSSGGRHKCNICDELCPSAGLLAQHKLSHIKVLSGNTCAVCREPLTSEHQFTSHQNEHHPAPLPQPCVVCRQTLVTDIEVNVHARFHSVQATAQATTVSAILSSTLQPATVFTTASTVSHTTSENSRNSTSPQMSPRLRCPECNIKLETPEEAEAHAQIHQSQQKLSPSARTYQCIKCQESFASESEIEAHVASHLLHEGSTHECHLCRGTFDTPLRLQCHLIEHTFEGCGSFTCYMCSSVFTTATRLQQHMVEHGLAARPYDCHHCHQKFFFRAELENHALSHPEATDGSCRECLASYPDLPRFHNRCSWPSALAAAEGTTAATRVSPARPTQNGSPHQSHQGETAPSTNGHSNSEADPLQEEDLQP